ncbi:MAG TPA: hypothetical protein VJ508_02845 [Saprospiraceae bacterium]|nr:hypothetical protein [Saprospiraceae bacterium]
MSQFTWTYIDDNGLQHRVGLFHGDNTGHLMIYCNTRIVVIDFCVTTSKNYSFFINDELCDIAVEESEGKFLYGFKVDEITDTPRNRGRRKMIRAEHIRTFYLILIFLLLLSLVVFLVLRFNG